MVLINAKFAPLFFAVLGSLEIFVNAAAVPVTSDLGEVPAFGQCGGLNYEGATTCPTDYECVPLGEGRSINPDYNSENKY